VKLDSAFKQTKLGDFEQFDDFLELTIQFGVSPIHKPASVDHVVVVLISARSTSRCSRRPSRWPPFSQ
jgi:hypothetical protein